MTGKLICLMCHTVHKTNSRHFPLAVHKKMTNKKGKEKDINVGFICRRCCGKQLKLRNKERTRHITPKT